jgi:signal transduction histidine kinase
LGLQWKIMPTRSLINALQFGITRNWRVLFLLMLILLHVVALRGAEDFWARALMLAHFGLFISWQPFMRGEQRLNAAQVVGIVVVSVGILFFLNWWLLALWVSVLSGIVGGKVFLFQARGLRRFYLVVLFYLVALLLVWIVPNAVIPLAVKGDVGLGVQYGLPFLFAVMLIIPVEPDSAETPQIVDFFYATVLFLLLVVLVLGAFAFMQIGRVEYVYALVYSLLILAAVLLALSAVWDPRAGFSGVSMYFSRYLLSIGMPFEQWLFILAELSQLESKPERFLKEATHGLSRLPWVQGGYWKSATEAGDFGEVSKHSIEYTNQELHLKVFTRQKLSPSLEWHFHLLGQLLGEFYVAKIREQKLQQQTYVQAVHETGARMTHDVKNLLQSLNVLCAAASRDSEEDSVELAALIRRQLPAITQRLQQTVDKLQKPQADTGRFVSARTWWEALKRAYQSHDVEFTATDVPEATLLPKELFDSAADNLLQNALRKRRLDPAVAVSAELSIGDAIELRVHDTGAAVASEVLSGLLRGPVPSESGFGIGLYQAARLADASGYSLRLSENAMGSVCFSLRGDVRRPSAKA